MQKMFLKKINSLTHLKKLKEKLKDIYNDFYEENIEEGLEVPALDENEFTIKGWDEQTTYKIVEKEIKIF